MGKAPVKAGNERREKIWLLMLQGSNAVTIAKTLNVPKPTIYADIRILTNKSKQYLYDLAKGSHVLMYQKAIDGTNLALYEAWNKFRDPKVPEKQKLGYLRLIGESTFDESVARWALYCYA